MTPEAILMFVWFAAGWTWGEWWTARQRKKRLDDDAGLKLLADMAMEIADRRKVVGRYMTIRVSHKLKTPQESYSLSLEAEGDPNAKLAGEDA
jgi:hypothetical protein